MAAILEGYVAKIITESLETYIEDLDTQNVSISMLSEKKIVLRNLRVKEDAMQAVGIPIKVKQSYIGTLHLQIPFFNLSTQPVVVKVSEVFILMRRTKEFDENEFVQIAGEQKNKAADAKMFVASFEETKKKVSEREGDSYYDNLKNSIMENIQINLSDVHIRYEDHYTDPMNPFALGVTMKELAVASTNKDWEKEYQRKKEGPVSNTTYKLIDIQGFAIYWDRNDEDVQFDWEMCNFEEKFQHLIPDYDSTQASNNATAPLGWKDSRHNYLLRPIKVTIKMKKAPTGVEVNIDWSRVEIYFSDNMYKDILTLMLYWDLYERWIKYKRFCPVTRPGEVCKVMRGKLHEYNPVQFTDERLEGMRFQELKESMNISSSPVAANKRTAIHMSKNDFRVLQIRSNKTAKEWWQYAIRCVKRDLREKQANALSWIELRRGGRRELRKKYIALYKRHKFHKQVGADKVDVPLWHKPLGPREQERLIIIEDDLRLEDMVLYRHLADAELEVERANLTHMIEAHNKQQTGTKKQVQSLINSVTESVQLDWLKLTENKNLDQKLQTFNPSLTEEEQEDVYKSVLPNLLYQSHSPAQAAEHKKEETTSGNYTFNCSGGIFQLLETGNDRRAGTVLLHLVFETLSGEMTTDKNSQIMATVSLDYFHISGKVCSVKLAPESADLLHQQRAHYKQQEERQHAEQNGPGHRRSGSNDTRTPRARTRTNSDATDDEPLVPPPMLNMEFTLRPSSMSYTACDGLINQFKRAVENKGLGEWVAHYVATIAADLAGPGAGSRNAVINIPTMFEQASITSRKKRRSPGANRRSVTPGMPPRAGLGDSSKSLRAGGTSEEEMGVYRPAKEYWQLSIHTQPLEVLIHLPFLHRVANFFLDPWQSIEVEWESFFTALFPMHYDCNIRLELVRFVIMNHLLGPNTPLAEVKVANLEAGVRHVGTLRGGEREMSIFSNNDDEFKCLISTDLSANFFNTHLMCWEPVMEKWQVSAKADFTCSEDIWNTLALVHAKPCTVTLSSALLSTITYSQHTYAMAPLPVQFQNWAEGTKFYGEVDKRRDMDYFFIHNETGRSIWVIDCLNKKIQLQDREFKPLMHWTAGQGVHNTDKTPTTHKSLTVSISLTESSLTDPKYAHSTGSVMDFHHKEETNETNESYYTIHHVPIDRLGIYLNPIIPMGRRVQLREQIMVCEVSVQQDYSNLLTIRSALLFRNQLTKESLDFELSNDPELDNKLRKKHVVPHISPGGSGSAPLSDVPSTYIRLRPSSAYHWSDEVINIADAFYRPYYCICKPFDTTPVVFACHITIESNAPSPEQIFQHPITIVVSANLEIKNLIPANLDFVITSVPIATNLTAHLKHTGQEVTNTVMRAATSIAPVVGKGKRSSKTKEERANSSDRTQQRQVETTGFIRGGMSLLWNYMDPLRSSWKMKIKPRTSKQWSTTERIYPTTEEDSDVVTKIFKLTDKASKHSVRLFMDIGEKGGMVTISVYAPLWLVNHSGMPLWVGTRGSREYKELKLSEGSEEYFKYKPRAKYRRSLKSRGSRTGSAALGIDNSSVEAKMAFSVSKYRTPFDSNSDKTNLNTPHDRNRRRQLDGQNGELNRRLFRDSNNTRRKQSRRSSSFLNINLVHRLSSDIQYDSDSESDGDDMLHITTDELEFRPLKEGLRVMAADSHWSNMVDASDKTSISLRMKRYMNKEASARFRKSGLKASQLNYDMIGVIDQGVDRFNITKVMKIYPRYIIVNNSETYNFKILQERVPGDTKLLANQRMPYHPINLKDPKFRLQAYAGSMESSPSEDTFTLVKVGEPLKMTLELSTGPLKVWQDVRVECGVYMVTFVEEKVDMHTTSTKGARQDSSIQTKKSKLSFEIKMDSLGVSLVDNKPQELINITLQEIRLDYNYPPHRSDPTNPREIVRFSIHHIQVDNQMRTTIMPVVLQFSAHPQKQFGRGAVRRVSRVAERASHIRRRRTTPPARTTVDRHLDRDWEPTLELETHDFSFSFVKKDLNSFVKKDLNSMDYYENFSVHCRALNISLDGDLVAELTSFAEVLSSQTDNIVYADQGVEIDYHESVSFTIGSSLHHKNSSTFMYFQKLTLPRLRLTFTYSASQSIEGVRRTPLHVIKHSLAVAAQNIGKTTIRVKHKEFEDTYTTLTGLVAVISRHYAHHIVKQAGSVLGHSLLIGDPLGLAHDFTRGLSALMSTSPLRNPKQTVYGIMIFACYMLYGPFEMMRKITYSLGVIAAASTMDQRYISTHNNKMVLSRPMHLGSGLYLGSVRFAEGLIHGLSGIFILPILGAKNAQGLSRITATGHGLAVGVAGGIMRPLVGALDLVTCTWDGLAGTVCPDVERRNLFTHTHVNRERQPRSIGYDRVLRNVSSHESNGQNILSTINGGRFCREFYLDHCSLGSTTLMMSSHRLLLLQSPGKEFSRIRDWTKFGRLNIWGRLHMDRFRRNEFRCVWSMVLSKIVKVEMLENGIMLYAQEGTLKTKLRTPRTALRMTTRVSKTKTVLIPVPVPGIQSIIVEKINSALHLHKVHFQRPELPHPASVMILAGGDDQQLFQPQS